MLLLPNETISITRTTSTDPNNKGYRSAGTPDPHTGIVANVQNLTAREKIMLPEQDRSKQSKIICIDSPAAIDPIQDDIITLASDSTTWAVFSSDLMPDNVDGHWEIIALREGS